MDAAQNMGDLSFSCASRVRMRYTVGLYAVIN